MIRINLLPVKKRGKKKVSVPSIPILPIVILSVVTILAIGYLWFSIENKISTLKAAKVVREKTLADLKSKIKEVENFERDNKKYEEKTNIIEQLRKKQSGPVRLLDEISTWIPDRVWLSSLNESGGTVNMDGSAFSNSDIVTFVTSLKGSKYLGDVTLVESKQAVQQKAPVFQFKITCKVKV